MALPLVTQHKLCTNHHLAEQKCGVCASLGLKSNPNPPKSVWRNMQKHGWSRCANFRLFFVLVTHNIHTDCDDFCETSGLLIKLSPGPIAARLDRGTQHQPGAVRSRSGGFGMQRRSPSILEECVVRERRAEVRERMDVPLRSGV